MARTALSLFLVICFLTPSLFGQDEQGCYTILAGKAATADGSVLLGHNEDNGHYKYSGMIKVARKNHKHGDMFDIPDGGRIPQVETTFAYYHLMMPGIKYSDAVLNEFGVAVVSNNCQSREDKAEFTENGIDGPTLRILVAQRARTAKEGVKLIGSLVERFGYKAKGRTMVIADPNEGWLMGLVKGKHWAAARVPDDQVALMANSYTIRTMDLDDKENFLACPDLVDYATKRGWFNPDEGPFSFEKAYSDTRGRVNPANTHRQWSGLMQISANAVPIPEKERLPFSVIPKKLQKPQDLTTVLRNHYENAPFWQKPGWNERSPHKGHSSTICNPGTNSSSVFQLRSDMPVQIGALWYLAMWQPCTSVYLPIYFGMDQVPDLLVFEEKGADPSACPMYKTFGELALFVDKDYRKRIKQVALKWTGIEDLFYCDQESFEKRLLKLWKDDRQKARDLMINHCNSAMANAYAEAKRMTGSM